MLADSQFDSVGATQFQQMDETIEDDFLAQLTSAGVPLAPRPFNFSDSVQETLQLWRQGPETIERVFLVTRNSTNAKKWISSKLFDGQFDNESQVSLALEMRTF